jgi:dTDP-glucose 4,6-dehydratase
LGWEPSVDFESGLGATVDWYLRNEAWWRGIEASKSERQGLALTPERAAD